MEACPVGLEGCLVGTPSGMLLRDPPLPAWLASRGLLWEWGSCPAGPPESTDPSSEATTAEDLRLHRLPTPVSPVAAA